MKTLRILVTLLTCSIILFGCEDDPQTIIEPEPQPNRSPLIDRLIVPKQVNANTPVQLQVIARDPDKDKLSIIWEVTEGSVKEDIWTPPNRAGEVTIVVHVTDGTNPTVSLSKTVNVIKEPEPTPEPITTLPPPPDPIQLQEPVVAPEPKPVPEPEPEPDPVADFQPGIQPGVGIAGIKVGDTLQRVEELHGKAAINNNIFSYEHLSIGGSLENNRVKILAILAPRKLKVKTEGGNTIGSPKASVEQEFGIAKRVEQRAGEIVFWYLPKGINFRYDQRDRVDAISVYKPIR